MTHDARPIACTLWAADLASQAARWRRLIAASQVARVETQDGIRLRFSPAPGVAETLGALVAVERECCAWAAWSVGTAGEEIELHVASTGAGVAAIQSMLRG